MYKTKEKFVQIFKNAFKLPEKGVAKTFSQFEL